MPFAATDLDDERRISQPVQQQIARLCEVALPDRAVVEHPVRIALVGNRFVTEFVIPDMRTGRTLDEVLRMARQRARGVGRRGPGERRQGLLAGRKKAGCDKVSANRAARCHHIETHDVTTFLKYAMVSFRPSSSPMPGCQSRCRRAFEMSGRR